MYKVFDMYKVLWSFNMVSEVKESNIYGQYSSDLWSKFDQFSGHLNNFNKFYAFMMKIRPILRTLQWYKTFFLKRGDTWV